MSITVGQAGLDDIGDIAPLFDAYRQFYEQKPDLDTATTFLTDRLTSDEATVYVARDENQHAVGFTQLYPSYCSVAAKPIWILYDLFVAPHARRRGVAMKLLETAQKLGADTGAAFLRLETDKANIPGQTLYERMGWEKETVFLTYTFTPDAA